MSTRHDLIKLDINTGLLERACDRCETARARFDELDRPLFHVPERLEEVCADIPEE